FALIALFINLVMLIRERTETRLREQRGLLRGTLTSIGDAVITTDNQGRITFINPVGLSLTGWSPDSAVGQDLGAVLHIVDEKTRVRLENPAAQALRDETPIERENHSLLVSLDGREIPVESSASSIRDAKGKLVGIVLVVRDITERRRAEEALLYSEERYRTVAETASDAIITLDRDDKILFANRATEEIFGYPRMELMGQDLSMLMSKDQPDEPVISLKQRLDSGEEWSSLEGVELVGQRKNGQAIPLEISLSKFFRNGAPYFTTLLRDITERKQAEKRMAAQYAATRALADSDTLRDAAPKILQAICESAGWQIGCLWTLDRDADVLRCAEAWHDPSVAVEEFAALTREILFVPGMDLPGRVWATQNPAWISDVAKDTNFPRAKVAAKNNLHGAFGFPIVSDEGFTGVVEFFSLEIRPPDEAFLRIMSAVGSQIGQFVERKKAEEALRLSREQQAIILQGVADGITAQDTKGRLIYANDAAARLIGYSSPQALLEAPITEVMDNFQVLDESGQPVSRDLLPGRLALAGEQPQPMLVQFRNARKGEVRWSLISATPVRNQQGQVQFAINIFHDITERQKADAGSARLAAIVDSSEDAILSKTVDGVILSWNPGAARLYGYSADEVIGKSAAMLYPPDRLDEFHGIIAHLKQGESAPVHDTERISKDGRRIYVSASVSPIKNAAGKVIAASSITRDITQRKRAEETQQFLAKAGSVLASSLDYGETLKSIAKLAVPEIADWCAVDIVRDEGEIERVAIEHVDPEKIKLAHELEQRYPPDPNSSYGVHNVLRTGKSEIGENITEEQLAGSARDVTHLKLLVEIGLKSYVIAPLTARGRTLGAITFVSAESGRHYGPAELAVAEELARRAALSVDNARLYRDAQRLNQELEARVVSRTIELQETNEKLKDEMIVRNQANQQLRQLSEHLQSAREEERIRIAREIHDELGQVLTAIKIDVSLLGEKLADKGAKLQRENIVEEINSTLKLIDETIEKMRHIIRELRPEILDHLGLSAAIEWQVQEFQGRTGIKCQYTSTVDDSHLDLNRATAVFRILQEALTNVARHAHATRVEISLKDQAGSLVLEIRDNGKGISESELVNQKSFGILGMRERALAFDGEVQVNGAPRSGTHVKARIPV
ncbi:MAG TPA: PAS domain S-box protein, partial [Anaerolineae bacterium]